MLAYALLSLLASANALPYFAWPAAGTTVPVNTAYNATWSDNTLLPPTSAFGPSRMDLCTGTSGTSICPLLITPNFNPTQMYHQFYIPAGIGGAGQYFLRIQSLAKSNGGQPAVACTWPFTVTGLTGPVLNQVAVQGGACFAEAGNALIPTVVPAAVSQAAKQTGGPSTKAHAAATVATTPPAAKAAGTTAVVAAVSPAVQTNLAVASLPVAVASPTSLSSASSLRPALLFLGSAALAYAAW